jgi:hypothetical protein
MGQRERLRGRRKEGDRRVKNGYLRLFAMCNRGPASVVTEGDGMERRKVVWFREVGWWRRVFVYEVR